MPNKVQKEVVKRLQAIEDFLDPCHLFYDQPFSLKDWDRHQRWRRYCPKGLVCIRAAFGIYGPLVYFTLLTVLVGVYHELAQSYGWPRLSEDTPLTLIFTSSSFALALLMVFRTNSSYDRWWEARQRWGTMFTQCRTITRQCMTWMSFPEDKQAADMVIRWCQALPYLALYHLTTEDTDIVSMRRDLTPILTEKELYWLIEQPHKPLAGLSAITLAIANSNINEVQQAVSIDNQLTAFAGAVGACERILRQPIPQAYTRHTSRFLMIWLTILPFATWAALDWACVVFCPLISFMLLGIENIGVQIEQPFHVLPLRKFCEAIKQDVQGVSAGILSLKQTNILQESRLQEAAAAIGNGQDLGALRQSSKNVNMV
eukprot:TRINITY_DN12730_c0_g1_i3.p1 TRINITY_DN12730_c0_g1~~TRINITY_DN12730_c0_g1_i3.p1  ORF type:complete len:400 (-),score=18.50 TRINITY_DN12730_c0_g1_i3:334-1449(-)